MAHFYGTIKGQRGQASRLGGKTSGLETYAASWQGAVSVRLWVDEATGKDMSVRDFLLAIARYSEMAWADDAKLQRSAFAIEARALLAKMDGKA